MKNVIGFFSVCFMLLSSMFFVAGCDLQIEEDEFGESSNESSSSNSNSSSGSFDIQEDIEVIDGVLEVDEEKERFKLEHEGKYRQIGYWYKGEDDGYDKEKKYNGYIDFEDVEKGDEFRFHKATTFSYIVIRDSKEYQKFMTNPSAATIRQMDDRKIGLRGDYNENGTSTYTRNININLDEGDYFVVFYKFNNDPIQEKYVVNIGTVYSGSNYSEVHKFIVGNQKFELTFNFS